MNPWNHQNLWNPWNPWNLWNPWNPWNLPARSLEPLEPLEPLELESALMSTHTLSTIVGTGGALVTTLSFLPQLVRVRRQGGRDLSLAMLAMYLTGSGLWLVYGVLNGAIAVIAANIVAMTLVSAIVLLKIAADRRAPVTRRLRIAIDMDEVMADALAEHVRRYNAHFGARLAMAELRGRHLEEVVPPEHREATEALLDASFFENLEVLPDCRDVIAELAARHEVVDRVGGDGCAVLVRCQVPLAAAPFSVHPAGEHRLLRRQGRRQCGFSDRRSRATLRALQGTAFAVLGAPQRRRDTLPASRIVGGRPRVFRAARLHDSGRDARILSCGAASPAL